MRVATERRARERAARAGASPYRQRKRTRPRPGAKGEAERAVPSKSKVAAAKTGEWMGTNITLDDYDGDMDIAAFGGFIGGRGEQGRKSKGLCVWVWV